MVERISLFLSGMFLRLCYLGCLRGKVSDVWMDTFHAVFWASALKVRGSFLLKFQYQLGEKPPCILRQGLALNLKLAY